MKKFSFTIFAMAAALAMSGQNPGINSGSADGFLLRSDLFNSAGFYGAAADQFVSAEGLAAPAGEVSEAALLLKARIEMGLGRTDFARSLLESFSKRYPASDQAVDSRLLLGDCCLSDGDLNGARRAYDSVDDAALAPADERALALRKAYLALCDESSADALSRAERYLQIVGADRRFLPAYNYYMGCLRYRQGRRREALAFLETVDSSEAPGNAAGYQIAAIRFAAGEWREAYSQAAAMLKKATAPELAPQMELIAGVSLVNLDRRQEAMPYLWRYASAVANPAPEALYILGASEYDAAHWSEAIGLLQRVIGEETPLRQSAYLYLGQAYTHTGNKNAALMAFDNAYRLQSDSRVSETALYNIIAMKSDGGRTPFASSVGLLEEFIHNFPGSTHAPKVARALVDGYMAQNDYENALKVIESARTTSTYLEQARQRVLFVIGTRDFANGRYNEALARFNQAAAVRESVPEIRRQITLWTAETDYRLGRYDSAVKNFNSYLKTAGGSDANRLTARYGLGYALFAKEDYQAACRQFRAFVDASGSDTDARREADALSRIGDCLYYTSDFAGALDAYTRSYDACRAAGDYPLYQTALMQGLRRDQQAKRATLDKLIAAYPNSPLIPDAMLQKAESFSASADNRSAMAVYSDVIDRYPGSTHARQAMLQLAITRLNGGERDAAVKAYKRLVELYPSSEEAKLAVDDLKRIYADEGNLAEFKSYIAGVAGAPSVDSAEYDNLAFAAAEKHYATRHLTDRLEKYLADYPDGANASEALYMLASDAAANSRSQEAMDYASRLVDRYPHSANAARALLIKAEAEVALGRVAPAYATYGRLASLTPDADLLHEARMGVLRTAIPLRKADEALDAAALLADDPGADAAEIGYLRGEALALAGRHKQARAAWLEVMTAAPTGEFAARSAVMRASSLFDDHQNAEARKAIDTFLDSNPPYPYWMARGFILLSDILRAGGEKFEADEYLRSLRANYPGSEPEIFRMIDERLPKQ